MTLPMLSQSPQAYDPVHEQLRTIQSHCASGKDFVAPATGIQIRRPEFPHSRQTQKWREAK